MGRETASTTRGAPRGDLATLQEGDVLCDRHRRECYQVTTIDEAGVGLHRDGVEFYTPRSLFVTWYGQRLFSIEDTTIETPEWCERARSGADHSEVPSERPPTEITARSHQ